MKQNLLPLAGFAVCALVFPNPAPGQEPGRFEPPQKATLVLEVEAEPSPPGSEVALALLVEVEPGWHVNSRQPTYDYLIPTDAHLTLPAGWPSAEFSYPEGTMQAFAFADEPLSVYDGQFVITAKAGIPPDAVPESIPIEASVRYQACNDRSCLPPTTARAQARLEIGPVGAAPVRDARAPAPAGESTAPARSGESGEPGALALFLVFGLIGGLLLNAMPCVLPVLSLKLLGLVKSAAQDRRAVVSGSLATAGGILASFWALAAVAILAKSLGASVGWGIQFQQPVFVTALTVVVVLFCLNLWGLFEVPLPQRLAGLAASAGSEGLPAHFTAGLFATLMATPCSAPFLGTAVGFALAQSGGVILAIFTAVGAGMAIPYFLLAAAPGTVKVLPKPGVWMDHFRHFMGYLLAAAAVWLLYVLSSQVSRERLAFIQIALLALSFFVWMRSRSGASAFWRRVGILGTLSAIAAGLLLAASGVEAPAGAPQSTQIQQRIPWVAFDRNEAEHLAEEGNLVFVDVTADWCFTCKVNERLVLETEELEQAFSAFGVIAMKADWTNRDDGIAAFLADHGKYGIPFYLLYRPGLEPYIFSELLTKDAVLDALREAAGAAQ